MDFIFGGVYQGKLEYVMEHFNLNEQDVYICDKETETLEIDFSKTVIYKLEEFTLACVKKGIEAKDYLKENRLKLEDKIIICADVSQGIVPMDKEIRAWREMNGRTMIYLTSQANHVIRMFCGLPQVIKGADTKKSDKAESYIHFIRHGTTEGNLKRWYYGHTDLPLLEEGKELLASLKKENIYPKVPEADFYTSGLIRTEETFRIIFGDKEHGILEDFREMSFGDYEKHSYEELKDIPEYQTWISDETGNTSPPNGESPQVFRARVGKGLKQLMGLHKLKEFSVRHAGKEAHSVVVCHGGVISAVMSQSFPEEDKHFFAWIPEPGHGYTIKIKEGKPVSYSIF
ncbi:histidine phosphatase family protein [Aminipila sp.]|uniref:histidine phosphatase family protein n=1 Tax=Aminipila sp. TaxID=2060095 RepID=UPI002899F596|nr:histidine phosphatase family protein [Aminipila sp.]